MALPGYKSSKEIQNEFPLHWYIWNDDPIELDELLTSKLVKSKVLFLCRV